MRFNKIHSEYPGQERAGQQAGPRELGYGVESCHGGDCLSHLRDEPNDSKMIILQLTDLDGDGASRRTCCGRAT